MKVALVVMPFAAADRPSLAAGLLQSALKERGIACDSKYFNVTLSKMLGHESYRFLSETVPTTVLAGEWAFSQLFYGETFSSWESYRREVLDVPVWGMREESRRHVTDLLGVAPSFLRIAFESNDWGAYDLVAFTSTFEQTMPSLCLARLIRERYPHVKLAAGGANFEAGMGRPYMERFPFLDFVCLGEGDVRFPELCESLRDGRPEVPPGILHRAGGEVADGGGNRPSFVDLDRLPFPDFDDFHQVFRANHNGHGPWPVIPVEASRGCWWGQKAHCTFCGLNGEGMAFRRKSWRRVADETAALAARYRPSVLQFADNILGVDYFDDLLPHWAGSAESSGVRKFFEVKSNLKRTQVDLLARSGVSIIQAGIESFSDHSLRVMRKGVSGAQNAAILRWSKESGVTALWNLIFGFPKEDPGDYDVNLDVMRRLTHLDAPSACAPIRMDRFSPNFTSPAEHGFRSVRPMPAYRHVFPFPEETLHEMAYYFDYDHDAFASVPGAGAGIVGFGDLWRERAERGEAGTLAVRPHLAGGHVLVDTRFNRPGGSLRLTDEDLAVLLACDAPASAEKARATASAALGSASVSEAFERLHATEAISTIGENVLTLALLPNDLQVKELARAR